MVEIETIIVTCLVDKVSINIFLHKHFTGWDVRTGGRGKHLFSIVKTELYSSCKNNRSMDPEEFH